MGAESTSPALWTRRRAELVEDFEREVYGRVPKNVPRVTWSVVSTDTGTIAGRRVLGKQLSGHVDNSAYPDDHRRHSGDARRAGRREGSCAGDDHVPARKSRPSAGSSDATAARTAPRSPFRRRRREATRRRRSSSSSTAGDSRS